MGDVIPLRPRANQNRNRGPKPVRGMLLAVIALALVLVGLWRMPEARPATPKAREAEASEVQGRASVIDGDTIRIGDVRIRLSGVDAPESRQLCTDLRGASYRCGAVAADALDDFLAASRPTRCRVLSHDRYGRAVGDCARADGADVSAWLVRNGYAVEWVRYSGGRFSRDEDAARARHAGVWQGAFDKPWDWRAAHAHRQDGGR